jgi:O-acetylhomoserine/O-acetylserine sulfhydrylase-like pyridoxal-dependent enzyme
MKFATKVIEVGQEPEPATESANVPFYQTALKTATIGSAILRRR